MKALLVGGGAREHAIAAALKKDPNVVLYTAMKNKNPGLMRLSAGVSNHDETDEHRNVAYAKKIGADFAIVGPETPLERGTADALEEAGIPCVGPKKALARIEWDKEFMRSLLDKYKIPCSLDHRVFDDYRGAWEYLDSVDREVAVKPVGLTGGKGVKVMGEQLKDKKEAKQYVKEVIEGGIGGGKVLLEEKASGEEFTMQAFVDGKSIALMPAVQDHKRAYEGDTGHNTGGMGSYSNSDSLLPFVDRQLYEKAGEVIKGTVKALKKETGEGYKGILYGQFMVGGKKLKLIEFNCRFGDPEAMNVLSLIKTPMSEVCESIIGEKLGRVDFESKATVCKYVVPVGYGLTKTPEQMIVVDEKRISSEGALLYYAAVNEKNGTIYTTSSRSLGIVGKADTLEDAERICENAVNMVSGESLYHRRDIGTKELIETKMKHLKALR